MMSLVILLGFVGGNDMTRVTHKTFLSPVLDMRVFKPWADIDEELRQQAEAFVNEVGPDRVLWITERTTNENRFVIVVWYRDGGQPT